jgi:hypothetical protein
MESDPTPWRFGLQERTPTCTSHCLLCPKRAILIVLSGGGNEQNINMDRSRPPLRWMALEAAAAGLKIQEFESELPSNQMIHFQESLHGFWRPFEWIPFPRLTFEGSTTQTWK